jgi:hypothetical protein
MILDHQLSNSTKDSLRELFRRVMLEGYRIFKEGKRGNAFNNEFVKRYWSEVKRLQYIENQDKLFDAIIALEKKIPTKSTHGDLVLDDLVDLINN